MKTIVFVVLTALLATGVVASALSGGSIWLTAISACVMVAFEYATFVAERKRNGAPQVLMCAQKRHTRNTNAKITGAEIVAWVIMVPLSLFVLGTSGHAATKGDLGVSFGCLLLAVTFVVTPIAYHMVHKHQTRFWH